MASEDDWVCLGVITQPHGVKGLVRIKPFTGDARAVAAYGEVTDRKTGRRFTVSVANVAKGMVTARIENVTDRDQAAALKGVELWVPRPALPETEEEEYYHHDMIGLAAVDRDGVQIGEVVGVENYGAGDLLELRTGEARTVLVPFTSACVPEVDLDGARVVVDIPPGLMEDGGDAENTAGKGGKKSKDGKKSS
jgi:16S rRNA processing protein RimM